MTGIDIEIANHFAEAVRFLIAVPLLIVGVTLVMLFWREVTNG